MTASYRLIDYSLRPAKYSERKMLCEAFAQLRPFAALNTYQYIGFGSIWFSDCSLFHRTLGINEIYSMEREVSHEERFRFNNPFKGITLLMGDSGDLLSQHDLSKRSIIWLDYDDSLSSYMFDDVRSISSRATTGTALTVTVQAQDLEYKSEQGGKVVKIDTVEVFSEVFGVKRTPPELKLADLRGWQISSTIRSAILIEIEETLNTVNLSRGQQERLKFMPIASFEYDDGAKMTTISGVFVAEGQLSLYEECRFDQLSFHQEHPDRLRIHVPMLTPREMRYLEKGLPTDDFENMELGPVPEKDARSYAKLYRYLPNFASFDP